MHLAGAHKVDPHAEEDLDLCTCALDTALSCPMLLKPIILELAQHFDDWHASLLAWAKKSRNDNEADPLQGPDDAPTEPDSTARTRKKAARATTGPGQKHKARSRGRAAAPEPCSAATDHAGRGKAAPPASPHAGQSPPHEAAQPSEALSAQPSNKAAEGSDTGLSGAASKPAAGTPAASGQQPAPALKRSASAGFGEPPAPAPAQRSVVVTEVQLPDSFCSQSVYFKWRALPEAERTSWDDVQPHTVTRAVPGGLGVGHVLCACSLLRAGGKLSFRDYFTLQAAAWALGDKEEVRELWQVGHGRAFLWMCMCLCVQVRVRVHVHHHKWPRN